MSSRVLDSKHRPSNQQHLRLPLQWSPYLRNPAPKAHQHFRNKPCRLLRANLSQFWDVLDCFGKSPNLDFKHGETAPGTCSPHSLGSFDVVAVRSTPKTINKLHIKGPQSSSVLTVAVAHVQKLRARLRVRQRAMLTKAVLCPGEGDERAEPITSQSKTTCNPKVQDSHCKGDRGNTQVLPF